MRNSSLVKRSGADNSTGLKLGTEAANVRRKADVVGEHSQTNEARPRGLVMRLRRDPAGISSDNGGENPPRRKSKVS